MSLKRKSRDFKGRPSSELDFTNYTPPGIEPEKWAEMMEVQERDDIVLSIREEIMSNVMEQCQKIHVNRNSIDLLVDCAYEAWKDLILLNFLHHDDINKHGWNRDEECRPCPPDNMSLKNIKIESVKKVEEEIPLSMHYTKCELPIIEEDESLVVSIRSKTVSIKTEVESDIGTPPEYDTVCSTVDLSGSFSSCDMLSVDSVLSATTDDSKLNRYRAEITSNSTDDSNLSPFTKLRTTRKKDINHIKSTAKGHPRGFRHVHNHITSFKESLPPKSAHVADLVSESICSDLSLSENSLVESDSYTSTMALKFTNKRPVELASTSLPHLIPQKYTILGQHKGKHKLGQDKLPDSINYGLQKKSTSKNKKKDMAHVKLFTLPRVLSTTIVMDEPKAPSTLEKSSKRFPSKTTIKESDYSMGSGASKPNRYFL